MNTTKNQCNIGLDGMHGMIDNLPQALLSTNSFRRDDGAHLIRGR